MSDKYRFEIEAGAKNYNIIAVDAIEASRIALDLLREYHKKERTYNPEETNYYTYLYSIVRKERIDLIL